MRTFREKLLLKLAVLLPGDRPQRDQRLRRLPPPRVPGEERGRKRLQGAGRPRRLAEEEVHERLAGEGVVGGLGIPEADGLVSRGGCEQAAIGRPGHTVDRIGVAGEGVEEQGGLGVPKADGVVTRGGGEQAPIGRPGDLYDHLCMTSESVM